MPLRIPQNDTEYYTDIDPSFTRNPKTGDLMLLKNQNSIKRSIRSLLSTSYGERLFQPTIGESLRAVLFEPIDAVTALELRDRVLKTLQESEPRISNVYVDVLSNSTENYYEISVEYSIEPLGMTDRVNVILQRIR